MSDGALRKYRPLSGYDESFFDVLAGENITTPALVILSMLFSVTDDDAAPTIASTPSPSRRSTVCVPTVGFCASLESPSVTSTGLPSAPPAALMSLTAK